MFKGVNRTFCGTTLKPSRKQCLITDNDFAIQNGVMGVFLTIYTAVAATVLAPNPIRIFTTCFTVLAYSSMMNLYSMFLYKFCQIIANMDSRNANMCPWRN